MARVNQGGSVLVFIVVAVVMAGLLVGGVYLVRQLTAEPAETLRPSQTAENKPDTTQKDDQKTSDNKKTSEPKAEEPQKAADSTPKVSEPASELPKTGPSGMIAPAFMLAILSMAAVSYVRSRRLELPL
jgi:LPXTG-motif cell wall-anchored protein